MQTKKNSNKHIYDGGELARDGREQIHMGNVGINKKRMVSMKYLALVFLLLVFVSSSLAVQESHKQRCSCIREDSRKKIPYLKIAEGKFISPHLNKELSYVIHGPDITDYQAGEIDTHLFGCAVILKNLPIERLGQASDAEVIQDLIQKDLLVVEVDYRQDKNAVGQGMYKDFLTLFHLFGGSNHPAAQPKHIEKYYADISRPVPSPVNKVAGKYKINPKPWTYVMPAGFTVTRHLPVDTLTTKQNVEVPLKMDVIHPFRSKRPVTALLEVSTGFLNPDENRGRLNRNSAFAFTWTLYGWSAAIMDNVPNLRGSAGLYGGATSVPYGPHFPEKRALRLLRAHQKELQLNGKVVVCGISKSCRRAAAAALINEDVDGQPSRYADYPLINIGKQERISINYVQKELKGKLVGEKNKGPHAEQGDRFDGVYLPLSDELHGTKAEVQIGFMDRSDPPAYITLQDRGSDRTKIVQEALQKVKGKGFQFKTSDPLAEPNLDHNYNSYKIDEMIEFFNSVIDKKKEE